MTAYCIFLFNNFSAFLSSTLSGRICFTLEHVERCDPERLASSSGRICFTLEHVERCDPERLASSSGRICFTLEHVERCDPERLASSSVRAALISPHQVGPSAAERLHVGLRSGTGGPHVRLGFESAALGWFMPTGPLRTRARGVWAASVCNKSGKQWWQIQDWVWTCEPDGGKSEVKETFNFSAWEFNSIQII